MKLLNCKQFLKIATAVGSIFIIGTSYANWYRCPSATDVAAGNYGPFQLCSGDPSKVDKLRWVYTNTRKTPTPPFWGVCEYNANNAYPIDLKIFVASPDDIRSDSWTLSPNTVCGSQSNAYRSIPGVSTVEFYVNE